MADDSSRRRWMSILAKAPVAELREAFDTNIGEKSFNWLRAPEFGTVMVRGRMGGVGDVFNLGEMSVTRCALQLGSGEIGHAYIAGRDANKARIAAQCDALMQGAQAAEVARSVIEPMRLLIERRHAAITVRAEQTKVDFFTLARGEG